MGPSQVSGYLIKASLAIHCSVFCLAGGKSQLENRVSLPVEPRSSKYLSKVWGRTLGRVEDRREEVGHGQSVAVGR